MSDDVALSAAGLRIAYGPVPAVVNVDLVVRSRVITTIVGSNGAGKTTILKGIVGLQPVAGGRIWCYGAEITGRSVFDVVRAGVALVPEGRRLFPNMTVRENLEIGAYLRSDKRAVRRDLDHVLEYFPALAERLSSRAMVLSGGQQQMVAIGRALMSAPRLILLDEPTIGLAPAIVQKIGEIIRAISLSGVDVLLVEQNAHLALKLSRYAYIIENGTVTMQGSAADLEQSEIVRRAYLGM